MICLHLSLVVRPGGALVAMVWFHPYDRMDFRIAALTPIDVGVLEEADE